MNLNIPEGLVQSPEHILELCEQLHLDVDLELVLSGNDSLRISGNQGRYQIEAPKEHMLYRGLLTLASQLQQGSSQVELEETPVYQYLGAMFDCSRNAVLTVASCKKMIQYLALMGYNQFQLYMEDTYQLSDQPYFGYFRGAYTPAELTEIEDECHRYGMEFVPCIQTLAHLHGYLKWNLSSIQSIRDIENILLVGAEESYKLIEKMFQALSSLTTRKINIGMDEAHLLGLGRYLIEHGFQNRSLLMCQHLERVLDLADAYGFECSMWSDMFFQLLSTQMNYTGKLEMDEAVKKKIDGLKKRVKLIYWDYYQTTSDSYSEKLQAHLPLGTDLAFASGAWKWTGFTPDNRFSLLIAGQAHEACQKFGVQEVTITAWGDNGAEAASFSILPSLLAWAEWNYRGHTEQLASHFVQLTDLSLEDFLLLDTPNQTPSHPGQEHHSFNPSRYLLYQDVLCPLLLAHTDAEADSLYFDSLVPKLEHLTKSAHDLAYLFDTQAKLCRLLARKTRVTHVLRQAYESQNLQLLEQQMSELEQLKQDLKEFHQVVSQQWMQENKIFGLDTLDLRLGGLAARIQRAQNRLQDYVSGNLDKLEELEEEILPFDDFYAEEGFKATSANQWHTLVTASTFYTT
ncbi:beta-N-acetylhexosaminidase [Streptococcus sp. NLN76]|uniref:beta-N-acetylhexosaminidase n=1 Tax=Streptococcus sp. NLN76 TaxID=2822800 RepID=UPI0018A8AE67|nr:beta-N-acetylhexosaminidase [Streptococcus sp. NLN76]MBF8970536.1 beta-N-acetylhexosaminidase [Streptococcus sp. NLN76]